MRLVLVSDSYDRSASQANASGGLNLKAKKTVAKKAPKAVKKAPVKAAAAPETTLLTRILKSLDDDKAEEIVTIDLAGRAVVLRRDRDRDRALVAPCRLDRGASGAAAEGSGLRHAAGRTARSRATGCWSMPAT